MEKEKKIDICYIISHGFASRMVTQTNLLGKLRILGKSVAVISPDINDPLLKQYCKDNKIQLFYFSPNSNKWSSDYTRKRRYLFEKIKENPALYEKHVYELLYSKIRNPLRRLKPLLWMLIHYMILIFPRLRKFYLSRERKMLDSVEADKLLNEINPSKLISTYPVNLLEGQLLFSANKNDTIVTWIHLLSWDNITCKGRFPALAKKYIVWGEVMKSELVQYYNVLQSDIFMSGVPHFDLHSKIRKESNLAQIKSNITARENNIILFAMSSPRFAPYEIEIVEKLASMIDSGRLKKYNLYLVIRPHPQNVQGNMSDASWLPRLQTLNSLKNVYVDFPNLNKSKLNWSMQLDDMKQLSQLIAISALVINSGSTVSIDSLYHRKPVILSSFDGSEKLHYWKSARRLIDYTHLKKMLSYKGVSVSTDYDDLISLIINYLENPSFNMDNREITLKKELYDFQGKATENVINILCNN